MHPWMLASWPVDKQLVRTWPFPRVKPVYMQVHWCGRCIPSVKAKVCMTWFGFEADASLGDEAIDEHRLVLNALEPPPDDLAS